MPIPTTPRFSLGQVVATPGALDLLVRHGVPAQSFLSRHRHGDWGDVCPEDWEANQNALETGARLLSNYTIGQEKIWIITDAADDSGNRASTCVLLPEDY